MKRVKNLFLFTLITFLGGFSAYSVYQNTLRQHTFVNQPSPTDASPAMNIAKFSRFVNSGGGNLDFTEAAEKSTPAVVHIQTSISPKTPQYQRGYSHPLERFFGDDFFWGYPQKPQQEKRKVAFGSGVIISKDGYIITNNHVVENGDEIEVTLSDKSTYSATVIGTDKSTDIALVKINGNDLPHLSFSNSDEVRVGEWVLAVGNPFNLASTVTAGIVSAKGRNINILKDQAAIESFIQTDAAVNPGNSGGALVNLNGDLIGINTAIATPTGTYAGYSFAVPSNLAAKIVNDLMEYGMVQRGFLGVTITDINSELAEEKELETLNGVYVNSVADKSAAKDADLEAGDVILKINDVPVNTASSLQEQVAKYSPGDEISITFSRKGKVKTSKTTLKNRDGSTALLKKEDRIIIDKLGNAEFVNLSKKELKELELDGGAKLRNLGNGFLRKSANVQNGFVITKIDRQPVRDIKDLAKVLENKRGGVMMEGVYPGQKGVYYYAFGV